MLATPECKSLAGSGTEGIPLSLAWCEGEQSEDPLAGEVGWARSPRGGSAGMKALHFTRGTAESS